MIDNRPYTIPPLPQLPFKGGDSLPPMKNVMPTWVRTTEGWTQTVWATEPDAGLALQVTPWRATPRSKLVWHLAILHVASGFTAVSLRDGNTTPIEYTAKNLSTLNTLIVELHKLCDWTVEQPEVDIPTVVALIREHLPATPMWRAWRYPRRSGEPLECKWHSTEKSAATWAQTYGGWYLVEHWTVPPRGWATYELAGAFELRTVSTGELPEGCAGAMWRVDGERRSVTRGKPAEPRELSPLVDADAMAGIVDLYGWAKESRMSRLPTGEYPQGAERALHQGILRRVESDGAVWWVPSIPAMLARARQQVYMSDDFANARTTDALRKWRASRKDGRERASYADGPPLERARFALFCDLLFCIRRDREAREAGKRFELTSGRFTGKLKVLSHEAGVAVLEIDNAAGMMWLTLRTTPVVSWAPSAALTAARVSNPASPDYFYSTIEEHRARDWAENHAKRMREGTAR